MSGGRRPIERRFKERPCVLSSDRQTIEMGVQAIVEAAEMMELDVRRPCERFPRGVKHRRVLVVLLQNDVEQHS